MSKPKIAFICVHNSCRSQIAEAFGKVLAADVFESYSAGTETKPQINQDAVRLMKELYGIDMEKTQYSKLISAIPKPDIAISMGCNVSCPFINYARTRPVYDAYRKAGYSKSFLDAHREEITLHKAAKAAFDEAGLKKLPKAKDLSIEYAALLKKKKEAYPDYRKARDEMQELMKAQKNVEMFFAEEKDTAEKEPTR